MRLIHCACASDVTLPGAEHYALPAIPGRKDLRFLDEIAREVLPVDPTPRSLKFRLRPTPRTWARRNSRRSGRTSASASSSPAPTPRLPPYSPA
ncbi:hypothetical protein [Corynebacterium aquatimens]|uniref:hypothetical protein n=1 Tax=Corynebacterium aquatimens TaxID=1190508 RepID=UPI003313635A